MIVWNLPYKFLWNPLNNWIYQSCKNVISCTSYKLGKPRLIFPCERQPSVHIFTMEHNGCNNLILRNRITITATATHWGRIYAIRAPCDLNVCQRRCYVGDLILRRCYCDHTALLPKPVCFLHAPQDVLSRSEFYVMPLRCLRSYCSHLGVLQLLERHQASAHRQTV